uniref:F-box domain-containing protein n=1 Tax=Coccidioides posadasii RMSCC 3488 TaxID=454284 RepID=A0A0J6I559_COCPO|nr:F-box domain-containing protein [Coccidioides posadasii RMSCC 3488]
MEQPPQASLLSLPNELLDHIISFLSSDTSPSLRNLREIPDHNISASPARDLKAVSRTTSRLRPLARPYLFSYSRYELRDQDRFLSFIRQYSLGRHVRSLVISVRSIFPGSEKPFWWKQLLAELDPEIITLIAPPFFLADIAQASLEGTHTWAFDVSLQTIHFQQPRRDRPLHGGSLESTASPPEPDKAAMGVDDVGRSDSFFTARPWTEILFNEGSSIKAYRNEKYYFLHLPSLMNHWGSVDPLQNAILPYPVIRNMTNLRYLSFQLAPSPKNLHKTFSEEQKLGSLDPKEPWMELDRSYWLISHSVRYLAVQGKLEQFRTWDFELQTLRESIVAKIDGRLRSKWKHDGTGLWIKNISSQENSVVSNSDTD